MTTTSDPARHLITAQVSAPIEESARGGSQVFWHQVSAPIVRVELDSKKPRTVRIAVLGDGRSPVALRLQADLRRVLSLGPGWDGGEAQAVAVPSVEAAVQILKLLWSEDIVPPHLSALPDGGVQLDWRAANESIEIEVDPVGDALATVVDDRGNIVFQEEFERSSYFDEPLAGVPLAVLKGHINGLSGRVADAIGIDGVRALWMQLTPADQSLPRSEAAS